MISSQTSVQASKAERYFESLCKHFARKVEVERRDNLARVLFPFGICKMSREGEMMHFLIEADTDQALQQVQYIIDSHVTNFGELRDTRVEWQSP